ncbi:MAG: class I SAM-dependent methyltransferase [Roseiflexus sp.]
MNSDDVAALHAPMAPVLKVILGALPSPEGPLLDVGCGTGSKTALLRSTLNFAGPLLGIDCNRESLSPAAVRGRMWVVGGDAHMLPLCTACCGAAVCLATLGMLHDQRAALRELRRVVRPGGWLVVVTATTAWASWSVHLRSWTRALLAMRGHEVENLLLTTPEPAIDLALLLRDAGWSEVRAGAFVIETGDAASQDVLPLFSQSSIRQQLTPVEVRDYDALVAGADVELLPLMLVAIGR